MGLKMRVSPGILFWVYLGPLSGSYVVAKEENGSKKSKDLKSFTFEDYVQKYRKFYKDPKELARRRSIYERNVNRIEEHNRNRVNGHWLGTDAFTDMEPEEMFLGYDKSLKQQNLEETFSWHNRFEELTGVRLDEDISSLPETVDWRKNGVTTPVKSQGQCGSCWAFASTAVLESHLAIQTGTLFELSVQQLVSCVPNKKECGGDGGCLGATAELAFSHVQNFGMVTEWQFGYQSYHPDDAVVDCSLKLPNKDTNVPMTQQLRNLQQQPSHHQTMNQGKTANGTYYEGAVMSIGGWVSLPSNDYTAAMNALAKFGPLAVSVACYPWFSYRGGIFESSSFDTPGRDTDVNHLVVLEGYGTDANATDYWLVRNSWGPQWGEQGYIRLRRQAQESQHCGMDITPADGVACQKDDSGQFIHPPNAQICGNSGILYDVSLPIRAFQI